MKNALACIVFLLAGCGDLPRDPDRTSDRIAREGTIRIGVVAGDAPFARAAEERFLRRLTAETGARPQLRSAATEWLFQQLERGDLDLVLTPLDPKSPWARRLTLGPPLADHGSGDRRVEYHAAMRNGENRWIMTVEKIIRATADKNAAS